MEQQLQVKALPGTKADSILNDVYRHLSVLRSKYNVPICDKWITLSSKKHIKQYWIEGQSTTSTK